MLNREERRRFNEIAQTLTAENPRFWADVDAHGTAPTFPTALVLNALLYIVGLVMVLLLGWPAVGPTVTLFAVTLAVAWLRRRRHP